MGDDVQVYEPVSQNDLPKGRKRKEEPKEGKALKGWATFFFVLTCVATGLIAASLALPFFLIIVGVISVIIWLVLVAVGTIFTIGMIWLSDDIKAFNSGWMSLNDKLFNSGSSIADTVEKAIPAMLVIGGTILVITWILMMTGIITDKNRKKFYTVMIITLGILSLLYIVITIFSVIAYNS